MKSNIIPVGEDQKPIIELTNEIIDTFNRYYGEVFSKVKIQLSETPRLVGTDGNAKMSKSLGNCIYLADSNEIIEEKVMAMYTDPTHIRVEDPGNVEGNVVFTYLDIFDPNKSEVAELKAQYQKGGLGDVILKKRLAGILQELITPIREKRERLAEDPRMIMDILKDGTATARKTAQATLAEVRQAMKIDYF
jgi:tryptophanyl-tRNA synthetase